MSITSEIKSMTLTEWLYILCILATLGFLTIGPWTSVKLKGDTAIRVLQSDGYTNIELTGYKWFTCGHDDTFSNGFKAVKNGQTITGCVCSGWLKSNTIRID